MLKLLKAFSSVAKEVSQYFTCWAFSAGLTCGILVLDGFKFWMSELQACGLPLG